MKQNFIDYIVFESENPQTEEDLTDHPLTDLVFQHIEIGKLKIKTLYANIHKMLKILAAAF